MVPVVLLQMLRSVELNNQPLRKADKVDNVRTKRCLSPKLVAVDLPGTQVKPKTLFGACGLVAKTTGKVALVAVAVATAVERATS